MTPSIFNLDESDRKQRFVDAYIERSKHRTVGTAYYSYKIERVDKHRDDCYYIIFTNGGGWYFGPRDRHSDADRQSNKGNIDFFAFTTEDNVPHVFDVSTNEKAAKIAEVLKHFIATGVIDMNIGESVILQDDDDFII